MATIWALARELSKATCPMTIRHWMIVATSVGDAITTIASVVGPPKEVRTSAEIALPNSASTWYANTVDSIGAAADGVAAAGDAADGVAGVPGAGDEADVPAGGVAAAAGAAAKAGRQVNKTRITPRLAQKDSWIDRKANGRRSRTENNGSNGAFIVIRRKSGNNAPTVE